MVQGDALHFMLAMFFFMCNISFAVIDNYFFIAFITGLTAYLHLQLLPTVPLCFTHLLQLTTHSPHPL